MMTDSLTTLISLLLPPFNDEHMSGIYFPIGLSGHTPCNFDGGSTAGGRCCVNIRMTFVKKPIP